MNKQKKKEVQSIAVLTRLDGLALIGEDLGTKEFGCLAWNHMSKSSDFMSNMRSRQNSTALITSGDKSSQVLKFSKAVKNFVSFIFLQLS
jgi:hypothetical protein